MGERDEVSDDFTGHNHQDSRLCAACRAYDVRASSADREPAEAPGDEPPDDFLRQAWPWAVYITAAGMEIHHELTGTRLRDLHEAARKLNAYQSAWEAALRSAVPPPARPCGAVPRPH